MKLLRITANGLPLFNGLCDINFIAQQRVSSDNAQKMSTVISNGNHTFYQNNLMAFVGINASGKTTILKLLTFVCNMMNNMPINNIPESSILNGLGEGEEVIFDIYFYSNSTINMLHSIISNHDNRYVIIKEYIKSKPQTKVISKKSIFDFKDVNTSIIRSKEELFLLDDVSIMVGFNKSNTEKLNVIDMLQYTNINELNISKDCPSELIEFFDPSIEYLHIKKEIKDWNIRLKFKHSDEIFINKPSELNNYLSSGTIKGINIFSKAINTFKNGGYLIVDELENHFNQEIVSTLVRFYMNKKINPYGAMLIFSTHYSELLDEFDRNDSTYIVRNNSGISVENLALNMKRNDIKKSEAFQSDYLKGTVPDYGAYISLKKALINSHKEQMK